MEQKLFLEKIKTAQSKSNNSIQENREYKLTDELNADMSSSFRGNPDRKVAGGCHLEKDNLGSFSKKV